MVEGTWGTQRSHPRVLYNLFSVRKHRPSKGRVCVHPQIFFLSKYGCSNLPQEKRGERDLVDQVQRGVLSSGGRYLPSWRVDPTPYKEGRLTGGERRGGGAPSSTCPPASVNKQSQDRPQPDHPLTLVLLSSEHRNPRINLYKCFRSGPLDHSLLLCLLP